MFDLEGEVLASSRALETAGIQADLLDATTAANIAGMNSVLFSWALRETVTNIVSNQYTDYFSRDDLKNIEFIHQYMQSCNKHELKTLYDLFLEQINNYMQLNSNQAKVYDFNKFIAKMKEKIDSFEENKTNELLDKLNTGFTILDKY